MQPPRLLFLSGSIRTGSLNTQLALQAAEIAESLGAEATRLNLAEYEMPFYNGDLEAESGLPEAAKRLKQQFIAHHGFFLASPEYNSSFSPLLKNALDWISRKENEHEPPLAAYHGKVAALAAASPGGFGGLRGLVPLRMMLGNIGVHVVPGQLAIASANRVFGENGKLPDGREKSSLTTVVEELVRATRALHG